MANRPFKSGKKLIDQFLSALCQFSGEDFCVMCQKRKKQIDFVDIIYLICYNKLSKYFANIHQERIYYDEKNFISYSLCGYDCNYVLHGSRFRK